MSNGYTSDLPGITEIILRRWWRCVISDCYHVAVTRQALDGMTAFAKVIGHAGSPGCITGTIVDIES